MIRRSILVSAAAILLTVSPACSRERDGPNDAQIAHIAYTAGRIDVDAGQAALAKARDSEVRAFAATMVRDHQAVNQQALALLKKLGVAPQANPTSEALTKQAQAETMRLGTVDGAAFDRAYVHNEIAFHRTVNDALRTTLIPAADNGELKALLQTGLALFEQHQAHAEALAAKFK